MSSKGTDVVIYIAKEQSPNTLPISPVWHTLRRTKDSLKKTVSTTASDEIADTRYEQGSIVSAGEAGGTIDFELSASSQDMFFEGVAFNSFIDSSGVSTLDIGGNTLNTYTIVKVFKKENVIKVFSGCRIGELTIQGDKEGKITGTATINATGYSEPTTSPVTNPIMPTDTPFMSSIDVNTFKINGMSTVGSACAQSFSITINNSLTANSCLGNQSVIPNQYTEGKVVIDFKATVLFTNTSKQWIPYIESRETLTAELGIQDKLGNEYAFNFVKLELNNEGINDTSANDDNTLALEFKHIKVAPTITRSLA